MIPNGCRHLKWAVQHAAAWPETARHDPFVTSAASGIPCSLAIPEEKKTNPS